MREMGQSAWLSTSFYNLQGTEGQSQCKGHRSWLWRKSSSQDAQEGQASHPPNPGAPRRTVPRARLQASRNRRRYRPHFVGPFARIINIGERKTPSSTSDI